MKDVAQFVVHVFDLIEAEGRVLLTAGRAEARQVRGAVNSFAMGATCLLIAIPLFIAGFIMLAVGLMWWLETLVTQPLAAALTGVAILVVAAAWLIGFRLTTGRNHQ